MLIDNFTFSTDALRNFESVPTIASAGIWATYPGVMVSSNGTTIDHFLTTGNGFFDQVRLNEKSWPWGNKYMVEYVGMSVCSL